MYEYPYYNQQYGQPNMQMQNQRMQYGQIPNGFQNQIPQNQQFSMNQPVVQNPLNGRMVNSIEEITANDVPMNVPYSIFPKNDLSQIYIKSWNANGTIQTIAYAPIQPENTEQGASIPQTDFNALNEDVRALRQEISERFDRLEISMTNSKTKASGARAKKEVATDE